MKLLRELASKRMARGQSAVEFVLVTAFVLIPLSALIFDGSNIFVTYHRLQYATREGAKVVTETTLPSPDSATFPATCNLNSCGNSSDLCCVAVSRTNAVLFDSGITAPEITGTWYIERVGDRNYTFFRVMASQAVQFFFQAGRIELNAFSTGYSQDEAVDEEEQEQGHGHGQGHEYVQGHD